MRHFNAAATIVAAVATLGSGDLTGQTIAIVNGTVHTMAGETIERGTVLIRDGRIAAVGGDDVPIPADARMVNAAGKIVTPGLLDSYTHLGLTEIGAYEGTVDTRSSDDRVTAAFRVVDGLNPFSTLIPVQRVEGITRAVVAPGESPTLISGQGALIDLGASDPVQMVTRAPAALFASLQEDALERVGGARGAAIMRLRETLQDARDFASNRAAFDAGNRREYAASRLDLEALQPLLRREVPLAVVVHRAADILATIRLAREFNLRLVLIGAGDGWMVGDEIAAAGVPVVLNPMTNVPSFENLGATLENAARLHAAGVAVAFGSFSSHNSRNLKQAAGNAVANGLPHDVALRAVSVVPARIWGVADRYGTLERGKDADVVVWSGDPLELTTRAEHVFIRGAEVPPDTRQRALLERYRTLDELPPAYRKRGSGSGPR